MPTHPFAAATVRPHRFCRTFTSAGLALAALLGAGSVQAQSGRLNDTGQKQCYDGSALVGCTNANTGDTAIYRRQDGRFGRDPAVGMVKVGSGAAGFDFSCVRWDGTVDNSASCTTALTANTGASASGPAATDWACTKDNHTNLIWSLQTVSGINWDDATSTAGGSVIGTHNSANRCGYNNGWRVPTRRELLSIVHHGVDNPAIDTAYFPSTLNTKYWSSTPFAPDTTQAWNIEGNTGYTQNHVKTTNTNINVRLVRSLP